jgi:hypothetical protein
MLNKFRLNFLLDIETKNSRANLFIVLLVQCNCRVYQKKENASVLDTCSLGTKEIRECYCFNNQLKQILPLYTQVGKRFYMYAENYIMSTSLALPVSHLESTSCQICCNMSFVSFAYFGFIQCRVRIFGAHLVFHIAPKKKDKCLRLGERGGQAIGPPLPILSTLETHFQTIINNMRRMNKCTFQLKKIAVSELRKSKVIRHTYIWIPYNDVLIRGQEVLGRTNHLHLFDTTRTA